MLIPLGFLAGSGAGLVTDYELIATAFGTGSSGTITFSSIPQDYKHLQIRYTAKSTSTSGQNISLRINGATGTVYAYHTLKGASTAVSSSNSVSANFIFLQDGSTTSTTAGYTSAGISDILDYASTTKNKTLRALYGRAGGEIYLLSGLYNATTAVNSLSFEINSGSFATTSRFSLYGIKG